MPLRFKLGVKFHRFHPRSGTRQVELPFNQMSPPVGRRGHLDTADRTEARPAVARRRASAPQEHVGLWRRYDRDGSLHQIRTEGERQYPGRAQGTITGFCGSRLDSAESKSNPIRRSASIGVDARSCH
jgi:hypothetical protein